MVSDTPTDNDVVRDEKTEMKTSTEADNPLADILSDVLSNAVKSDDVLEVNMLDSVNLSDGLSSLDTMEVKVQEVAANNTKSVDKTIQSFGDAVTHGQANAIYKTEETFNDRAADIVVIEDNAGENINLELAEEQSKKETDDDGVGDVLPDVEIVTIPALKNDTKLVSCFHVCVCVCVCV